MAADFIVGQKLTVLKQKRIEILGCTGKRYQKLVIRRTVSFASFDGLVRISVAGVEYSAANQT